MARTPRQSGGGDDFTIVSNFALGYRNREDITNLPPGVLVKGSQNVLTTTEERISSRKGYTLDGQASSVEAPILASYDWELHIGEERHLRAGFLTSAGNDGKLQYRYVYDDGSVEWRDLMTSLSSVSFNFDTFWDFDTEKKDFLLFINGSSNIYEWTGGLATYASSFAGTSSTITGTTIGFLDMGPATITDSGNGFVAAGFIPGDIIQVSGSTDNNGTYKVTAVTAGTLELDDTLTTESAGDTVTITAQGNQIEIEGNESIPELNFYNLSPFGSVVINGTTYAYTGYYDSVFTGVTPDPTSAGIVVGDIIHQAVKTTTNSNMSGIPANFKNALIANLRNQIYIGSLTDRTVYISKLNDYTDYTFASPRGVGEGALVTLDDVPRAFIAQEEKMTISAGKNQWYETQFILSSDLQSEAFNINRFKTTSLQGARSQYATTKLRNDIAFVSFEPTLNTIGRVKNVVITQQAEDISNSIKNDFDIYNFEDCAAFYFRDFLYVAVPKEGIVRIYNLVNNFWEAPQILPISRFSIIEGELFGHSYLTSETFKLFDGYNDNGAPINSRAVFSYNNYGTRTQKKQINQLYTEGYITSNTTITLKNVYEIDGCAQATSYTLDGTSQYVCQFSSDASLGKVSLGKNPLGGTLLQQDSNALPPKFRWIRTFNPHKFYEHQLSIESNGVDQRWELLAIGTMIDQYFADDNNNIKE